MVPALPGGWRRREGEKEKERRNAGVIRSRRKCRENVRRAFTIRDKIAEARILTAWSQRSSRKCLHRFEAEEQRREGAGKDGLWKTKRSDGAVGRLSLFMHPREGWNCKILCVKCTQGRWGCVFPAKEHRFMQSLWINYRKGKTLIRWDTILLYIYIRKRTFCSVVHLKSESASSCNRSRKFKFLLLRRIPLFYMARLMRTF